MHQYWHCCPQEPRQVLQRQGNFRRNYPKPPVSQLLTVHRTAFARLKKGTNSQLRGMKVVAIRDIPVGTGPFQSRELPKAITLPNNELLHE